MMAKIEKGAPPAKPEAEDKYEVEDALRCLTRAEEIKANKSLMDKVQKHAGEKADQMKLIAGNKADKAKADKLRARGLISDRQMARTQPGKD